MIIDIHIFIDANARYYAEMTETDQETGEEKFSWNYLPGEDLYAMIALQGSEIKLSDDGQKLYITAENSNNIFIIVWLNGMTREQRTKPLNGMEDLINYLLGQ